MSDFSVMPPFGGGYCNFSLIFTLEHGSTNKHLKRSLEYPLDFRVILVYPVCVTTSQFLFGDWDKSFHQLE